jgi:hypothetical protein
VTREELYNTLAQENAAMRAAMVGRANKARGLPRRGHSGFAMVSRKVQDAKVRMGSCELHKAMLAEYETPYPVEQAITPFWPRVSEILQREAQAGCYEGAHPPKLWELKFYTTRKGDLWFVTAIFDKEWTPAPAGDGGDN